MKKLKSISTAILLITGIMSSIVGALETIIKLMEKIRPQLKAAPKMGELQGIMPYTVNTFWMDWKWALLWIFGLTAIFLSIWVSDKHKD